MNAFRHAAGDWMALVRDLDSSCVHVDFHRADRGEIGFHEAMQEVHNDTLVALRDAQAAGHPYVVFRHGWSTSEGWKKTTSRSVVRGLMRSREATRFIIRSNCVQHYSVFIAAIRPMSEIEGKASAMSDGILT